ncbi:MAG: single-stranded-DNA-specific exonuclease C-terminal domain-containing protein, partial [Firmicutes bacterium]|nr:single-stranded-DNA-specific exonuclease C-terminal domain-containing protein [Bacillota bacterium]
DFILGLDIENPIGLLPNRDDFIKIFKLVKSEPNLIFKIEQLYVRLSKFKINLAKIYVVLEIFNELGIITISGSFGVYNVSLNKFNKKLNLNNSEILKKLTYL